jgi:hypothetical protein
MRSPHQHYPASSRGHATTPAPALSPISQCSPHQDVSHPFQAIVNSGPIALGGLGSGANGDSMRIDLLSTAG